MTTLKSCAGFILCIAAKLKSSQPVRVKNGKEKNKRRERERANELKSRYIV